MPRRRMTLEWSAYQSVSLRNPSGPKSYSKARRRGAMTSNTPCPTNHDATRSLTRFAHTVQASFPPSVSLAQPPFLPASLKILTEKHVLLTATLRMTQRKHAPLARLRRTRRKAQRQAFGAFENACSRALTCHQHVAKTLISSI